MAAGERTCAKSLTQSVDLGRSLGAVAAAAMGARASKRARVSRAFRMGRNLAGDLITVA